MNEKAIDRMVTMARVSVVGCSGSGKTTFARKLAAVRGVPHVELDALHWGPDWTEASAEELQTRARAALSGDAWVVDGNYQGKLGGLVWGNADTVVWLDPPRWRVMWQSVSRTLRRVVSREELWAGNRESWKALAFWRGQQSILWWAWTTYAGRKKRYEAAMAEPDNADLAFYRLATRRQARRFLTRAALTAPGRANRR